MLSERATLKQIRYINYLVHRQSKYRNFNDAVDRILTAEEWHNERLSKRNCRKVIAVLKMTQTREV